MATGTLRVVCYVNQFFGQLGGEEKAGVGPQVLDGAVGAAGGRPPARRRAGPGGGAGGGGGNKPPPPGKQATCPRSS